ncbi:MAG: TGS domain-containing protein, partial [Actinomycetota bacterium]
MHRTAEYGVAAHWLYKDGKRVEDKVEWLSHLLDWQKDLQDPQEFAETLKADLFEDDVFVFTPKGEVKSLATGATPLDFAYAIHTDVGHRCVGAASRDWLALVKTTRAQSKIRAWFKRERREDPERTGREILAENLKRQGLPPQKIAGSPLLADVIREMGFSRGESAVDEPGSTAELLEQKKETPKPTGSSSSYGIKVEGIDDVMLRLAKCCRPVPGDPIVGYISLGKGIT